MAKRGTSPQAASRVSPQRHLKQLVREVLSAAKTARRHRQSLMGANYYAGKMISLKAEAVNALKRLGCSPGNATTRLPMLVEAVFSTSASPKERAAAANLILYELDTAWADAPVDLTELESGGVFPLSKLRITKCGYLAPVGAQINGTYASGWHDACAVMMRRLLESVIIEAFERCGLAAKAKDTSGSFLDLTPLINAALAEQSWNLPRQVRRELPNMRDVGHRSAHNRYYIATKPDIDRVAPHYREAVEAFLHIGGLL